MGRRQKIYTCGVGAEHSVIAQVDEFIDVLIGNRRYVNCLYVYNKIDTISMEDVDRIARQPHSVVISCEMELNLDGLRKAIWEVRTIQSSWCIADGHC